MSAFHARQLVPPLVAASVLAACSSHHAAAHTSPEPVGSGPRESSTVAEVRADSIRHPYTKADVDFMSHMIAHHAQALEMARWAPSHGASRAVQTLAERIINGQQDEINSMQQWLRDRGKPVPEPGSMAMMHRGMMMPGMLTPDQMRELDQARGPEFDRLFLSYMIQHHRGAVTMVKQLFDTYGAARDEKVFKFANDVNVDQTTEIARMERMLASLPPA